MTTSNPFLCKVRDLRYRYGQPAADHFEQNPICNACGEKRLACLNVHHVHGKQVDVFETLCFNCHMLEHAASPEYTYEDFLLHKEDKLRKERLLADRNALIHELKGQGLSLRAIAAKIGISHVRVRTILDGVS